MTVGQAIRKARTERGYSMPRLAKKMGIQVQTIYQWEAGISEPRCWLLIALADALDISLDELVGRNVQEE